jgi:hypothetical protein
LPGLNKNCRLPGYKNKNIALDVTKNGSVYNDKTE